ncbi:MAG TPA: amidohydrolase family protein [Thermoguttaceae bacterium]|nr:amidohydrolase family protein [Thermoguttaceae bacterium]
MSANRTIFLLTALVISFGLAFQRARAAPPSTEPVEGLHENTPDVHALVGARIVAAPGQVIDVGTLVVRDGVIVAVGPDAAVPPDARVWPMEGKTIYAGLIDAYSPISVDAVSTSQGAPHWNPQVEPQRDAGRAYRLDKSLSATLRSQGVTCRLVVPDSGVIRGTSALVTTGDAPGKRALVRDRVALHMRLTVDSPGSDKSKRTYPRSPMGAVALARQAMYDADWYARAWQAYETDPGLPRPERNDALERLGEYVDGSKRVIVEASDEQYVLRADRFAREFALKIAVRGSGREYRRLEAIRATGRPVIVPLAFPKPPNVATSEAALGVSLADLMHWDVAPENAARLAEAGVPIAFCSDGLKSPKEFLGAVRTAVERGLDAQAALEALTTEPARLFGVSDRLGTLDVGKAAHLVVTDGDLLAKKTRVLETWVDGRRYEVVAAPVVDVRGTWRVTPAGRRRQRFLLTLSGKPGKLEGTVRLDKKKAEETKLTLVGLRDARFGCTFDGKPLGAEGAVQLSAVVSDSPDGKRAWLGSIHWPDGTTSAISVTRVESQGEEEESEDESEPAPASFPVNYPLGAFGRTGPPDEPRRVAFTGGTVWTCEEPGVLEAATVLVGEGKILAVGKDVDVPGDAVVVDCSGKHVTPGIIDCHSHMATDGGINEGTQAISAEVRIGDFLDAGDVAIYRQLGGGVTASHVLHGSANPIGGQNQLIKLRWGALPEELKFAGAPPTIKFALGENVKQSNWGDEFTTRYPQTRMGVVEIIRDAFQAAEEYARQWDAWRRTRRGLPPRRDLELEALVEVLRHERWIHCHAYRQDEVLALLTTLDGFGIRVAALQHVLEGYKVADAMARYGAGGSAFSDWWAYKFEVYDAIPYNGVLMHRAGVVVSFNSDSRELARHLNQEAAKAMKYGGLSPEEALRFVTLNPARQLLVDQYVGSLAPGKHADLVVWSGSPLANSSRPEQTWIDGRKYFDLEEDQAARQEARRRHAALVQKVLASEQAKQRPDEKDKDNHE